MNKYKVSGESREVGAIGIFEPFHVIICAASEDQADERVRQDLHDNNREHVLIKEIKLISEDDKKSIYTELKEAGVQLSSHESDLYAQVTPESTAIVKKYYPNKNDVRVSTFVNNIDHKLWYDIAFQYSPFWENKAK